MNQFAVQIVPASTFIQNDGVRCDHPFHAGEQAIHTGVQFRLDLHRMIPCLIQQQRPEASGVGYLLIQIEQGLFHPEFIQVSEQKLYRPDCFVHNAVGSPQFGQIADGAVHSRQEQRAGKRHFHRDDSIEAVKNQFCRGLCQLLPPAFHQGCLGRSYAGQGQPLALGEQVVVADKCGGGFDIITPVQQKYQFLPGRIQLLRCFGPKFHSILRFIASFDNFHSAVHSFHKSDVFRFSNSSISTNTAGRILAFPQSGHCLTGDTLENRK